MPVVVIGVNHRTAPLEVLEAMSIDDASMAKVQHALLSTEHLSEAVVLSTCNRTEVYAVAEKFHGGYADVRAVLGERAFLDPDDFVDHLYVHHDTAAVAHLFDVVSGLDSAVLGEHEIQGQVKAAWEAAQRGQSVGPTLNLLFRHALEAGKRARTETGIGAGTASVSYAAVAMATEVLGGMAGRRAVVLGTGDMGASMATSLGDAGVADLAVANRTHAGARDLAERVGGRAIRFADLPAALTEADVLFTSTGATSVVLGRAEVDTVVAARDGRDLLVVDIAMPRDIAPEVAEIDGVTVLDMDDVGAFASHGLAERRREVDAVRHILDEEIERYRAATSAREIAPVIVSLRDAAEATRRAEMERARGRLADLGADEWEAVDALTRSLVAKLLHEPTVALKDAAGTAKGDRLVQALRDLFPVDPA